MKLTRALCLCVALLGLSAGAAAVFAPASAYAVDLPSGEAASLIKMYYKHVAEWKGTFQIGDILETRQDRVSDYKVIVHVRYTYIPVPGGGRTDTGEDWRTFTFEFDGSDWAVTSMGGHMSATF